MGKPIKVLECIRQGKIGGGETHLLSLVENMDRGRYTPVVLSFTDGPMVSRLKEMKVPTYIIPTTKPFDFRVWGRVKTFLRREEIELVHAHGTRACSNVLWASSSLKIPVVYTIHGWSFHPDQQPLVRRIRIMGERYLTARAAVNIAVSGSNRQTGKEVLGEFEARVINNGIDRNKFDPGRRFRDIRTELDIPHDALLVLFIARFTAHKQPLALIDAFGSIAARVPEMHLLLVGDGDQKAMAERKLLEAGLQRRVHLESFRQDVPDVLSAADIFVLPSLWEGLPIGLLEAMAMGKAVIATNVDGTREVVQDGQNGLLIRPGDIPALSRALEELGRDPGRRGEFGEKAKETVRLKFDAAGMTREIEKIYSEVVGRG